MTDSREEKWIAAAREGDQGAFEELVLLYEKRVLALTQRMCGNPEDAAEAAQEAFLAAWQGLKNFRGDSSFSTWLYRLSSNACVDLLRREGRRQAAVSLDGEDLNLDIPSPIPSPQEEAERRELREQIEAGLRALPPEYREVLVLREMQQLRYDEIAHVLELDVGTVKSRISRGRKRLRSFLLEQGNFSPPPPSKETGKGGRS
ncbi:RNA polymerase sigma factor [uncultured Oscillibacter sp.]|jgi:RNA polymerase sigma-70 factor (ECF subfamily)|uniref:RNA polymerase sigma factor n=1 Tax=uncultured Oscillibacter sp. TaxID=876091 RepID=UPI0021747689|nr:sigma-70 family RNA polymerase sigma factor [uncultured Oscillibacter sp.]MCI9555075.1 sigma-70 family RNA polymerase sigma factor [Oscillibacter sp.]